MNEEKNKIIQQVEDWLVELVLGLNLCPFAKSPYQKEQIRFVVCEKKTEEEINDALIEECKFLDQDNNIETSLIICPNALLDFFDYRQFLLWAEQTLKKNGWRGVYQIASFHPDYVFANTEADDRQNLSNRSPYPILHLLREASLEAVLERYDNPDSIPENNIQTLNSLSLDEIKKRFSYLYHK